MANSEKSNLSFNLGAKKSKKPKEKSVNFDISMPESMFEECEKLADENNMTRAEYFRAAVRDYNRKLKRGCE